MGKKYKLKESVKNFLWKTGVFGLSFFMIVNLLDLSVAQKIFAQNVQSNIEMDAKIVKEATDTLDGVTTENVLSGEKFYLRVKYSVNSMGGGEMNTYTSGILMLRKPEGAIFDIDATKQLMVEKSTIFKNVSIKGDLITFDTGTSDFNSGQAGNLYMAFYYPNMETPDNYGASETFNNIRFTANIGEQAIESINMDSLKVINEASQEWNVKKQVVKQGNEDYIIQNGQYHVKYNLDVSPGTNDRYGRLKSEKFELTDILPTPFSNIKDGVAQGYPQGGGANDVRIVRNEGEKIQKELVKDTDYTLNYASDGTIASISFKESAMDKQSGNYIPAGTMVHTSFNVYVKYDYNAYEIPVNEKDFSKYLLDNQVTLTYRSLGLEEKTVSSNATIEAGWKEDNPLTTSIKVQKQVKIGVDNLLGNTVAEVNDFDASMQKLFYASDKDTISFGLFKDQEGKTPAKDKDGNSIPAVSIDENGRVEFGNLIAGTYYLKETKSIDGLIKAAVKKIVIAKTGEISVDGKPLGKDAPVTVINETGEDGFGYVAFWKKGTSAASTNANTYLKDVTFKLISTTDRKKEYEATSDGSGLVLFKGVRAGSYKLIEVSGEDSEFDTPSNDWTVNVVGNQVNYPKKGNGANLDKDSSGKPYITNRSTKGSVRIQKVNEKGETLTGSEFKAFGPYKSETEAKAADTSKDGKVISADYTDGKTYFALEAGWYAFVETKAPLGYALDATPHVTRIVQNTTADLEVTNQALASLKVEKKGQLKITESFKPEVPLSGAVFTVYKDMGKKEVALDLTNGKDKAEPAVITSTIVGGHASSNTVMLPAGTYWIAETITPAGYKEDTDAVEIKLTAGETFTYERVNEADSLGQIKITKVSAANHDTKIEGVTFKILNAENNDIADIVVTDKNGEAVSKFLPEGTYILEEGSAPTGYSTKSADRKFVRIDDKGVASVDGDKNITVENNKILNVIVENEPLVDYKIKKVEGTKALQGVKFKLYETEENAKADVSGTEYTSDVKGFVTFENLEPGTEYFYKETKPLSDEYIPDNGIYKFTSPGEERNYKQDVVSEIRNTKYGYFQVKKKLKAIGSDTQTPLGKITFYYYPKRTDNAANDKKYAEGNKTLLSGVTNSKGTFTSEKLAPGDYWLEEKESGNYQKIDPMPITVTSGETITKDVLNISSKGHLKIKKISSLKDKNNNVVPVTGARFHLYRYVGDDVKSYQGQKPIEQFTITGSEYTLSKGVSAGTYALIEVESNRLKEYTADLNTVRPVEIVAGEINEVYSKDEPVENTPQGRFYLEKFELWGTKSSQTRFHQAMPFNIYRDEDCTQKVTSMNSSNTGKVLSPYLDEGTYWVKENLTPKEIEIYGQPKVEKVEVKAGQNHTVDYQVNNTSPGGSEQNPLVFENIPSYSKIQITKVDSADHNSKLNGAQFEVYQKVDKDTKDAKQYIIGGETVYLVKASDTVMETGTADVTGEGETDRGEAYSVILEPGTYYVKEIKAPNNYKVQEVWTGPITLEKNEITKTTIENYKPTQAGSTKVDQDGHPIGTNFKFALFDNEADANSVATILSKGGTDAEKLLKELNNTANYAKYNVLQIASTNKDSEFNFKDLDITKTYYVLEIVNDPNYVRDESVHKVTIKKKGNVYKLFEGDSLLSIKNVRKGALKVRKVADLSGKDVNIDGVKFKLYKAKNDIEGNMEKGAFIGEYTTGTFQGSNNGAFLTGQLAPGWYILEETEVPEGIILPEEGKRTIKVEIRVGETNDKYWRDPIKNETNYGTFHLTKVSAQDPNTKLKATFELWKLKEVDKYEKVDTFDVTGDDYWSKLLPAGKYQLREISVEDGYTVDSTPISFEIEKGKTTGMKNGVIEPIDDYNWSPIIVKNEKKGSIKIQKTGTLIEGETPTALSGIEFTLYKKDKNDAVADTIDKNKVAGPVTSNARGEIIFKGIDHGEYWLKETKVSASHAKDGYTAGKTVSITVKSGEETTQINNGTDFTNESTYGKIKITKTDQFNSTIGLSGAKFNIYDNKQGEGDPIQTITTKDGIAYTSMLKPGNYYVKEIEAPSGYFLNQTVYGPYKVEAHKMTTSTMAGITSIPNKAKQNIQIVKKDKKTGEIIDSKYMEKAVFKLYATKENAVSKTKDIQTTGKEQKFMFTDLDPDTTYYVREVTPPDGYTLSNTVTEIKTTTSAAPSNVVTLELENAPKGSILIEKQAKWGLEDGNSQKFPLNDVTFELRNSKGLVATQTTDINGFVEFRNLDEGTYTIREITPKGFVENKDVYSVKVDSGEQNAYYTNENAIVNNPVQGKFTFKKTAPDGSAIDKVEEAKFSLYKDNKLVDEYKEFSTDENGQFTSGVLEPDTYELREVKAPSGFAVMDPIEFEVEAEKIVTVKSPGKDTIVNEALGKVEITKYSDSYQYDVTGKRQVMSDVKFTLTSTNTNYTSQKVTNEQGKIVWDELNPGTYTLKEEVPEGYGKVDDLTVVVKADQKSVQTYYPEGTVNGQIYNQSEKGRIVIHKQEDKENKALAGAEFYIYSLKDMKTPVNKQPLVTDKDGYAYSDLLDAASDGTTYLVKEAKAPDGYTLDDTYYPTMQEVVVKPIQDVAVIKNNVENDKKASNFITFLNKKQDFYTGFGLKVNKKIKQSDGTFNDEVIPETETKALLKNEQSVQFRIDDYAQGLNEIDAEKVTVTDEDMHLYYKNQDQYVQESEPSKQLYSINTVTVYRAYVGDNPGESSAVSAKLEYQTEDQGDWIPYDDGDKLKNLQRAGDDGVTLDLTGLNALHFRVVYSGTKKNFRADGIMFDVTLQAREKIASMNTHEIRQIQNTSKVTYTFNMKDEDGKDQKKDYNLTSNTVKANYPLLDTIAPKASIRITTDNGTTFAPGDIVYYTIRVDNRSGGNNAPNLDKPVVSFDLPVGVSLLQDYKGMNQPLLMLYGQEDNAEIIEPSKENSYTIVNDIPSKEVDKNGNLILNQQNRTKKVVIELNDLSVDTNNSLFIKFAGQISHSSNATGLLAPSFLNSLATQPQSAENPYGNSIVFDTVTNADVVEDIEIDKIIEKKPGGEKYAYSGIDITVRSSNNLTVYKKVKGQYDEEYLGNANIASTAPNGSIDYNIYLQNGNSDQTVRKARLVDILPFYGDTLVARTNLTNTTTARGTQLSKRPVLKSVSVHNTDGSELAYPYTIYYCVSQGDEDNITNEWTAEQRDRITREADLPMMYSSWQESSWIDSNFHKWTKQVPDDLSKVTAVGVEVDTSKKPLDKGEGFMLHVTMEAPNYATDQLDEIQDKVISNSAMGAVQRNNDDKMDTSDSVENDPVHVKLTLAKGSLGDYAFFDRDKDGIQDADEIPVTGLDVTLHTYKTEVNDKGEVVKTELPKKVIQTDIEGKYEFTNLDCNEIKDENGNKDDPRNYVGGAIYSYRVEFATPQDESRYTYVPTIREAGTDRAIDSNIEEVEIDGVKKNMTEEVRLKTDHDKQGMVSGENNPTLDAGFMALGGLGDYVWLDKNRNGIQDPDEPGVADVTVNLYTANEDGSIKDSVDSMKTGPDGKYLFEGLKDDLYVVEFDISKTDSHGYTPYTFTKPYVMAGEQADSDSNAREYKGSKKVARTDVIKLADRQVDLSIDAGLVYHSALSGYAFEDKNYNDIQDIGVPLPNTVVELYRIGENGVRGNTPVQTAVVGKDGKYFFDNLVEGFYQVHFTFPKGFEAVEPNQGNETIDSDVSEELDEAKNSGYTVPIYVRPNSLEEHWDAGAVRFGSIGDYVWEDLNKNGIQDSGETPIANVNVYLQYRIGDKDSWNFYAATQTNEHGRYVFERLKGSEYTDIEYRVIFDLPFTTKLTIPLEGTNYEVDSNALPNYINGWGFPTNAIRLGYGQNDMTWDAGIVQTSGSIGDYVWFDTNKNGIQDEENTGIEGIKVVLERNDTDDIAENGWKEVGTTTTNAAGYYRFDDLSAGYYRVRFYLDGYNVSEAMVGEDATIDSDGLTKIDNWYNSRPFYLEEGGFDMTWDCGVYTGKPVNDQNPPHPVIGNTQDSKITGVDTGDHTRNNYCMILLSGSALLALLLGKKRKKTGAKVS